MAINRINAPGIFTRGVVQLYQDMIAPAPFFTSLAAEDATNAKDVHIGTRRFDEEPAVDIALGNSDGHRNQFARSTSHLYRPPEYLENFDVTELETYDRVFGGGQNPDADALRDLIRDSAEKAAVLENKIARATERQWAGVMQTGIVVLKNNDAIDFRRKAASIVDPGAGGYWDGATPGILAQLNTACQFIRNEGKSKAPEFYAIMGSSAVSAFLNNAEIKNSGDKVLIQRMKLEMPTELMVGTVYHGSIAADNYTVHVLTYPENYDTRDAAGAVTRNEYIEPKNVVVIPTKGFAFTTKYAGLPALFNFPGMTTPMPGRVAEKIRVWSRTTPDMRSHLTYVNSRPLACPVSIDQIYTIKALA